MARAAKRRGGGGEPRFYGLMLACGGSLAASPGSALALTLWLLPGLLLWLAERTPGRPAARCLLLAGGAAALPGLAQVWSDGGGLGDAAALATDPRRWALPWAAQSAAWLLTQVVPAITAALAEAAARRQGARLRAARARLETEWSLDDPS